jgi:hypothetical protein
MMYNFCMLMISQDPTNGLKGGLKGGRLSRRLSWQESSVSRVNVLGQFLGHKAQRISWAVDVSDGRQEEKEQDQGVCVQPPVHLQPKIEASPEIKATQDVRGTVGGEMGMG